MSRILDALLLGPVNWVMSPWQRARRAEHRLAEVETATIYLRVILDGQVCAVYDLTAYRLESKGDWCEKTYAYGDQSFFTIETDVQVSLNDPREAAS
jgi:hypothetical protein